MEHLGIDGVTALVGCLAVHLEAKVKSQPVDERSESKTAVESTWTVVVGETINYAAALKSCSLIL